MANDFSLSIPKGKAFPETVKAASGEVFPIDADFRTVLKILRLHGDEGVFGIQKVLFTLKWFYKGSPPEDAHEALGLLYGFIKGAGQEDDEPKKKADPQFDYEFDAEEIYVSFIQGYGIDLHEAEFLHWHKFKMLLANLPQESAFAQKIKLRFMDLKKHKGEDYTKMSRAKREVQLPAKHSKEEAAALAEMMEKLRA